MHEKRGPLCSAPTFAAIFLGLGSPCPVGGSCVASAKLGPWVKGPVLCQVLGSDGSLSLASLPANARSPRTLSPAPGGLRLLQQVGTAAEHLTVFFVCPASPLSAARVLLGGPLSHRDPLPDTPLPPTSEPPPCGAGRAPVLRDRSESGCGASAKGNSVTRATREQSDTKPS